MNPNCKPEAETAKLNKTQIPVHNSLPQNKHTVHQLPIKNNLKFTLQKNFFFFFRKKKKYIYIYKIFFLHNLMPLQMKFNDYRKLQPILKKIIKPLIINKQKTNKSSLNILPCLFPYLLKM